MNLFDLPHSVIQHLNALDLEKLKTFRFAVQIDGDFFGKEFVVGFSEVRGLTAEVDVRVIKEGGYPGVHRFPRRTKQGPLILKRAMTYSRSMWDWSQEVINWTKGKQSYTRSLSVFLLDAVASHTSGGEIVYEVWQWDFFDAWPSVWTGPTLNSNRSQTAFESLTINHSGIVEAKGKFSGKAGEILSLF